MTFLAFLGTWRLSFPPLDRFPQLMFGKVTSISVPCHPKQSSLPPCTHICRPFCFSLFSSRLFSTTPLSPLVNTPRSPIAKLLYHRGLRSSQQLTLGPSPPSQPVRFAASSSSAFLARQWLCSTLPSLKNLGRREHAAPHSAPQPERRRRSHQNMPCGCRNLPSPRWAKEGVTQILWTCTLPP